MKNSQQNCVETELKAIQKVSIVNSKIVATESCITADDNNTVKDNLFCAATSIENLAHKNNRVTSGANLDSSYNAANNTFSNVCVNFGNGNIECSVDTGAEISVLKPSMLPKNFETLDVCQNTVQLQPAFGPNVNAKLCRVNAKLAAANQEFTTSSIVLTCAVTPELNSETALLTPADYTELLDNRSVFISKVNSDSSTFMLLKDSTDSASVLLENTLPFNTDDRLTNKGLELNSFHNSEETISSKNQIVHSIVTNGGIWQILRHQICVGQIIC